MSNRVNPARRECEGEGFTLVELLLVVAIIGILAGLSVVAFDAVGRRGALQNAAYELQGALSTARTRAVSRGHPVWVVFHPAASQSAKQGGSGAYLVIEDKRNALVRAPLFALGAELKVRGDVSEVFFLGQYSKKVRFGVAPGSGMLEVGAPFTGLSAQACSFCTGVDAPRGAIVFFPDGGARFVDGDGAFLATPNHSLALRSVEGSGQYLFAISGPSAYMASFSQ